MNLSARLIFWTVCIGLLLVNSPITANLRGQELPESGSVISAATAQRLVNAGYPDLTKQRLAFQFGMKVDHVFIRATPPVDLLHPQTELAVPAVLAIDVVFAADQRIAKFSGSGTATDEDKNNALRDQINNNPALTGDEMTALVTAGNGAYGPGQPPDLSLHLDASRWSAFLGAQLTVTSPQFQWRRDGQINTEARPGWIATASAQAADGSMHSYVIRFEPFAGQLVELNEVQP